MSVTWQDDLNTVAADLQEQAAAETTAAVHARMTVAERQDDLNYRRAKRQAERAEWAADLLFDPGREGRGSGCS